MTPAYEDAWAYGGIPRAVGALARAQSGRGHLVTVATTDACSRAARLAGTGGDSERRPEPAPAVRVFRNLSNRLAYDLQLYLPLGFSSWLETHAHRFDLAHLHAVHNVPAALAARAFRRVGRPYLLQPHGTAPLIERRRLLKWGFDRTVGRGLLRDAARWIAVSDAERRKLEALGLPADRVRTIPSALRLQEPGLDGSLQRGVWRNRTGSGDEPVILFLGKLTPRKRVDVLIHAFAGIEGSRARLVIAGPDMGVMPTLRAIVRARRLEQRVSFTGVLAGTSRLEALMDADVLAYPGSDEVLGLVPLESILCGTPVVVAGDSGCGETIGRVGGGLVVPPGDVAALRAALARMLDERARWRGAARAAQAAVRATFGAEAVADRMDGLMSEVVP